MASERPGSITLPPIETTGRRVSPSPHGLRQRPLGRASTFAEGNAQLNRRRSSFLSETFSETRKSLRSSTDDILLPRPRGPHDIQDDEDTSHWQSLALGLALLPAVGGLFFKDGSAVITDVTLLGLAAIFMNWALRSPWDWYRAAQIAVLSDPTSPTSVTPVEEEEELQDVVPTEGNQTAEKPAPRRRSLQNFDPEQASAQRELRFHELAALISCFIFPLLAAWLLHGIRSQLTRPSEGLVSNYNLTIFILVAEIRPLSHMIKLVQRRTLFLQRRVNAEVLKESSRSESQQLRDLAHRLEELEAHVADRVAKSGGQPADPAEEEVASKASSLAASEVKKTVQPELDALNRAMRRYEKRITISSVQIEARLDDLEVRLNDVVALAAAAQRNADRRPDNYIVLLVNWVCAIIVLPMQYILYAARIPGKLMASLVAVPRRYLAGRQKVATAKAARSSRRAPVRTAEQERRINTTQ
ncbi:hypothetical protein HRR83_009168 [Exophiala dermatitidis]|uniref:Uncharacterized protein n=2 Tax=Exophiala dermatitidis TaxID=5970 RepID=H6C7Y0_EXODN|nr:uncharacterized protein HMPREF1120_08177 [Exophiala dermatitidis NIH/UT8656]KAJ4502805.1 hypothetical protein HRR75_008270 [Exophiala dermatitidis]EHY60207.1 hypothetical protein HMPREF1120_08177 [Exophiala dermatitidis NIH/UT8656]KAJ4504355.1 hypothetical protein HRR74_009001 [Exophiala dermatitidis]KAJ4504875.1 hypothetical protein HRR73_008629 [Exophiala dermatitidis]KAJ4530767.1 hypothetical protein HRR76_008464 [Exophiala dermatitidis]